MTHVFETDDANAVWQLAFDELVNGQHSTSQVGRGGGVVELLHTVMTIYNPRQRWIIARQPMLNPAFAIAEVIWIATGQRDSAFLNYWNKDLPKFAGNGEIYHGAYGYRLRRHFQIDQLDRGYLALVRNPSTRQVVLQIWDAKCDLPLEDGQSANADIPCNVMAMLKIRDGKLEWTQINRSNDIIRGVPYNFVQFTTLQEIFAGWLGVPVGTYTHFTDSLHMYDIDRHTFTIDHALRSAPNTDSLALPKLDSEKVFEELRFNTEQITASTLLEIEFEKLVGRIGLPSAYRNLFLVLAHKAAQKRHWHELADFCRSEITNPSLAQLTSPHV